MMSRGKWWSETQSHGTRRDPGEWQSWDNGLGLLPVLIGSLETRFGYNPCLLNRSRRVHAVLSEPKELDLKM